MADWIEIAVAVWCFIIIYIYLRLVSAFQKRTLKIDCFDDELLYYIFSSCNYEAKLMINEELSKAFDKSRTLLHYAAMWNNEVIVRHLLQLGSPVDPLEKFTGKTPLMLAVERNFASSARILLEANANVDIVGSNGKCTLEIAFSDNNFYPWIGNFFLDRLKKDKEKLKNRLSRCYLSPYHIARTRDVELLKCIVKCGHKFESNSDGYKALKEAIEIGNSQLLELLIESGIDVNCDPLKSGSPLFLAVNSCNKEMTQLLLEHNADPNFCHNYYKYSILYGMFDNPTSRKWKEKEFDDCVELLLQYGAIPCNTHMSCFTIVDCARIIKAYNSLKYVIAQLAILVKSGKLNAEDVMQYNDPFDETEVLKWEKYFNMCLHFLDSIKFHKGLSLFHLLNASELEMKMLMRDRIFAHQLQECLARAKEEMMKTIPYYFKTLEKRIFKATRQLDLENEAIKVICKLFDGHYNQCYEFSRIVVGYLEERDLKQLCKL